MSPRRGGVAVPLVTLIGSFLVVLLLGGWIGGTKDTQSTSQAVRITVDGLTATNRLVKPLPGLQVRLSDDLPTSNDAWVCVNDGTKWTLIGKDWAVLPRDDGSTDYCRFFPVKDGKVQGVDLRLEKKR